MAFNGLVRGVVAVVAGGGWRIGDSEWRGSIVVFLGEIGCRCERGSLRNFDFLIKLFSKCFLRGAGKC